MRCCWGTLPSSCLYGDFHVRGPGVKRRREGSPRQERRERPAKQSPDGQPMRWLTAREVLRIIASHPVFWSRARYWRALGCGRLEGVWARAGLLGPTHSRQRPHAGDTEEKPLWAPRRKAGAEDVLSCSGRSEKEVFRSSLLRAVSGWGLCPVPPGRSLRKSSIHLPAITDFKFFPAVPESLPDRGVTPGTPKSQVRAGTSGEGRITQ